jgi:hypothetical protein
MELSMLYKQVQNAQYFAGTERSCQAIRAAWVADRTATEEPVIESKINTDCAVWVDVYIQQTRVAGNRCSLDTLVTAFFATSMHGGVRIMAPFETYEFCGKKSQTVKNHGSGRNLELPYLSQI